MRKQIFYLTPLLLLAISFLLIKCNKKEVLSSPALSDYYPMKLGKYIVYRADSTVTTQFGVALAVRSYLFKDSVADEITDNLGRKAYRIYRKITDTNGVAPYQSLATIMTVPVGTDWIEYIEDNLRYMKLRWPIREDMEWKGNSFIDVTSLNSSYQYLADWNYTYQNIARPYTVNGKTFDTTITVAQRDETIPEGPLDPAVYKQRNYSIEVYAKNVGLIYKEFLHYIYQPATSNAAHFEDGSYGLKLRIISHN